MITSTKNRHIVECRKLSQRKHRQAQNRFAVEGLQLLDMALTAGHTPLDVFYGESFFAGETAPRLLRRLLQAGGRPFAVNDAVMRAVSERDTPQGLIATFPLFLADLDTISDDAARAGPALWVLLDRLQDPGNLGTLIRTADAVAAAGVILLEPCVDPFDPKTVRGSMGSISTVPLLRCARPQALLMTLQARGCKITGADGYQGELPWSPESQGLTGAVALALGNEARGLSADLRPHLTHWVRLPLPGKAESLNLAVAGGVLMYHWLQRNQIS